MATTWTEERRRLHGEMMRRYWAEWREGKADGPHRTPRLRFDAATEALTRLTEAVTQFQRDCPGWHIDIQAYPRTRRRAR